jgi:hypothetical protein
MSSNLPQFLKNAAITLAAEDPGSILPYYRFKGKYKNDWNTEFEQDAQAAGKLFEVKY